MIISASRRTDIPALYAKWMANRIRAGYCTVPNPFNRNQVTRVDLRPEAVEAIVFWTRWPTPLMQYLGELESRGYRYYFQFTILGYPRQIDTASPPVGRAVEVFRKLAERISPDRVIWRYDPIVFSDLTPPAFHRRQVEELAMKLEGSTRRCVVSVVDPYRKAEGRVKRLDGTRAGFRAGDPEKIETLVRDLAAIASSRGMETVSCAEEKDFTSCGVAPGKCIDDQLIQRLWGAASPFRKDPHQRPACGCAVSRDIGMYDSCTFGCAYCYATSSFDRARRNHFEHDPESPSLLGRYEASPAPQADLSFDGP